MNTANLSLLFILRSMVTDLNAPVRPIFYFLGEAGYFNLHVSNLDRGYQDFSMSLFTDIVFQNKTQYPINFIGFWKTILSFRSSSFANHFRHKLCDPKRSAYHRDKTLIIFWCKYIFLISAGFLESGVHTGLFFGLSCISPQIICMSLLSSASNEISRMVPLRLPCTLEISKTSLKLFGFSNVWLTPFI